MFTKDKARLGLVVSMFDELIRKLDDQIKLEREFILKLEAFFMFEKKMEHERLKIEELDAASKKILENDRKY